MLLLFLPLETPVRQGKASAKEEPVVWGKDGVLWAGKAWSTSIGDLRLAYFTGSPEEIGAQMFQLVIAPESERMMEAFAFIKQQGLSGGFLERTFKNFYAKFKFIPTFKRHLPREYIRELEGFARATGDPRPGRLVNELLISNAWQDVSLVYGGCSFFAAWGEATGDGGMLSAVIWIMPDWRSWRRFNRLIFTNRRPVTGSLRLITPQWLASCMG